MRFLHTSDWHLGRIFHGLHMTDEQAYVLDELVRLAKDARTDAVLIAGDLYDRSVPPTAAVTLLNEVLSRLVYEAGQNVILIAGNHDSGERLGFAQNLLARNKLFITGPLAADTAPVVLEDAYGPIYFAPLTYGEPYAATEIFGTQLKTHEDVVREQIRRQLEQIPVNTRKVALAHVFLTGAQESPDSERPLAIGGATTVSRECFNDFHYTALGHLHACQGSGKVRYSGSLMKYSFNEANQKKGVHIIDMDGSGAFTSETIELHPRRDLACLTGSFDDLLNNPRLDARDNFLQITLTDEHPVLDAKYRLEQVYPNILHLQYQRQEHQAQEAVTLHKRRLAAQDLFAAFFEEVQGIPLNEAENKLLLETVAAAGREEDGHEAS